MTTPRFLLDPDPEPYHPRAMRVAPRLHEGRATPPPTPRRALLIVPFYPKDPHGSFAKHALTPALTMSSLAAATPPEWDVAFWDENLLQGPPPSDPFPAVVGITVHLTFARRAYALARWYRERGAAVVLGGLHVMACPDEAALHADAVAVGEGVQLWPRILRDAERGKLRERYDGDWRRPFAEEPVPRRAIVPRAEFLTTASLTATRGCHNRCGFCHLSTRGVTMPYQTRPPAQVAREIAELGEPYVVFVDNNLGSRPDYLWALCDAIAPLGVTWSAAVTLDVTDDPALVRRMATAGCNGVFVGLETIDGGNLADARKRSPQPAEYARRVALFQDRGIEVNGSFVFGFDHDRADVFERTVDWIEQARLACATFHILTPYPGTPLFRQMEAEGRLLHRHWEWYDTAHAVFRPRHMTPDELERGYRWCYRRLFGLASVWRRRPRTATSVPGYLAAAALYKHANRLWPTVIRRRWTRAAWRPFVETATRLQAWKRRRSAAAGFAAGPGAEGDEGGARRDECAA